MDPMGAQPTQVETRVEPYYSCNCFLHQAGLMVQDGWKMVAFEPTTHWDNAVLLVTYQRDLPRTTVMGESERLCLLARIIEDVTAASHRYHYADVLARYEVALRTHVADADTAAILAQSDLHVWEQRHEYHVPDAIEDLRSLDLRSLFLRVECGWRIFPVALAHAEDLRAHVRQHVRQRIAALEAAIREIGPSIAAAAAYGLDKLVVEGETLRARWERELASAKQLLLAPLWRADEPAPEPAVVLTQQSA
jgi:hypothetical protein